MGVLHGIDALTVVSTLNRRGLGLDEIERAMEKLVGPDWKDMRATDWHKRLREQDLISHDDYARFIDDLEALVSGRTGRDDPHRTERRWGRA